MGESVLAVLQYMNSNQPMTSNNNYGTYRQRNCY